MTGRHPNRYGTFSPGSPIRAQELTRARRSCSRPATRRGTSASGTSTARTATRTRRTIPGRAILASDPLSPGKMGFDEWVSADNFFDLDPVLGRNGVPEKFHGDSSDITTDEALKFIRKQADGGQAVPRRRLVRLAARAASGAAGRQGGLQRAAGEGSELLRRDHRRRSQRGPAARGAARAEGRRQHAPLVLQRQRRRRGTEVHRQPARIEGHAVGRRPARARHRRVARAHRQAIRRARRPARRSTSIRPSSQPPARWRRTRSSRSTASACCRCSTARRTRARRRSRFGTTPANEPATPRCSTGLTSCTPTPLPARQKAQGGEVAAAVLLYDVSKDPKETTDLAAQQPERVAKMTAALEAWKASVEKSLRGGDYGGQPVESASKAKRPKRKQQ